MDDAFVAASSEQSVAYKPEFFEQFSEQQGDIMLDDAFATAASASVVDYLPEYWNDANQALTEEGLHYEYSAQYWSEARRLLDKSDRRIFFMRWSAVAAILLLFSLGGLMKSDPAGEFNIASLKMSSEINHSLADLNLTNQSDVTTSGLATLLEAKNNISNKEVINNDFDGNIVSNDLSEQIVEVVNDFDDVNAANLNEEEIDLVFTEEREDEFNRMSISFDSPEFAALNLIEATDKSNSLLKDDIDRLNSPDMGIEFSAQNSLNSPLVKIEKHVPKATHNISLIGFGGIGNKWGADDYIPTLRTGGGFEYMRSSFGRMRNFEFGGSLVLNHVRQNKLGTERRTSVYEANGKVSKYWYKISIKDMIFANANFLVNYKLTNKHKIKFGLGYEHKLAVNSNMSFKDSKSILFSWLYR